MLCPKFGHRIVAKIYSFVTLLKIFLHKLHLFSQWNNFCAVHFSAGKMDIELFFTMLCPKFVEIVDIEYLRKNAMSTDGHRIAAIVLRFRF